MGNTTDAMDRTLIYGADAAVEAFLSQWEAPEPYIVAHTSGSTGKPKEIRLSKHDMMVSARATCRYFGVTSESHIVMPLSADYIAGKMMIVRAIVSRAKLTVMPPSRSLEGLSQISGDINLLPIVPSQLDGLLRQPDLSRIKHVIIGGAPLWAEQEIRILETGVKAYATYGMTETCSHVALRPIGHNQPFEAMPEIRFAVDDENCLIIQAPNYTSKRFLTTDIVELIDDRHFRWLGRKDHVINTGGIKVHPGDVETRLRPFFPAVDYYITSRSSEAWGQEIVMVAAHHGKTLDLTANLRRASESLPHHLLPKAILYTPEFEYTTNGKIKKVLPMTPKRFHTSEIRNYE